jgi:decaprenyl-phosphate phosphoribosyltransferase
VLGALIKSLRPHQWVKNLFVTFPLLFSKHLLDPSYALLTVAAFVLFCLLSGSVYLVNDIFDIEKDRAHPKKCLRPIPSGKLPIAIARTAAAVLILVSLGGSLVLGLPFFAVTAGYLIQNLAYSLSLKHIPFVDVLLIASGFLLRVLAGAFAIGVPASPWLLGCTFVLACFLGFGKRTHELANAGERASEQRAVLSRYKLGQLRVILWVLALATCAAYVLYTLSPQTKSFFGTDKLLFTSPFAAFGVVRFLSLVSRGTAESPTDEMLRDLPFMANLGLWAAATVVIIYFWR